MDKPSRTQGEINADAEIWLASYLRWYTRRAWQQRFASQQPREPMPAPSLRRPKDYGPNYDTHEERDMDFDD
jgi:hypothetical protein